MPRSANPTREARAIAPAGRLRRAAERLVGIGLGLSTDGQGWGPAQGGVSALLAALVARLVHEARRRRRDRAGAPRRRLA
jgi:hypothetical protein